MDGDEDLIIVGAKKVSSSVSFDKHDPKPCIEAFKKYFFDDFQIDSLIKFCNQGEIDKFYLRAPLWKLFLGVIPLNNNYLEWFNSISENRSRFKVKLKSFNNLKKLDGDPLGGINQNDNAWNSFFKDNELKKLITLDINRTYQDKDLFQNTLIKEMLTTILFIWSKDNPDVSYRQGMNEILAVLLLAIHPFYLQNPKKLKNNSELIDKIKRYSEEKRNDQLSNELYYYMFDESEIQADLWILFELIMKRGIYDLYQTSTEDKQKKDNFVGKKKDLFQLQYQDETPVKAEISQFEKDLSPLQRRCNKIYKEYLKIVDPELFNYMIKIDIDATIFLVRWLKCMFNREFHHRDVAVIWDAVLAYDIYESNHEEQNEKNKYFQLNMLDYIAVSMLNYIREEILRKDQVECLQRLFKYPPLESPTIIVKMGLNLKELIYKKLFKKAYKEPTKETIKIVSNQKLDNDEKKHSNPERFENPILDENPIKNDKNDEVTTLSKLNDLIEKYAEKYSVEDLILMRNLINELKSK